MRFDCFGCGAWGCQDLPHVIKQQRPGGIGRSVAGGVELLDG